MSGDEVEIFKFHLSIFVRNSLYEDYTSRAIANHRCEL